MSDIRIEEFVKSALDGDQDAFNELYRKNVNRAYFQALMLSRNDDIATESVQLAFIEAFGKLHQLEDHTKFPSWLISIVRGNTIDLLRKRKILLFNDLVEDGKDFEFEDTSKEFSPEENFKKNEYNKIVNEIVDSLPYDQRVCILMFYFDEMKITEISSELNISESTVKSRLRYGRERIKSIVLEKERKGIKLYGFGPALFFVNAIREYALTFTIDAEQYKKILGIINSSILILAKMPKIGIKTKRTNNFLKPQLIAFATVVASITGVTYVFNNINAYNNLISETKTERPAIISKTINYGETTQTEEIPFETIYIEDNSIEKGVRIVKQQGITGERTRVIKQTFVNDLLRNEIIISDTITRQSVNTIILIGTKEKPVVIPPEPPVVVPEIYTYTFNFVDDDIWGIFETSEIAKKAIERYEKNNPETLLHSIITECEIIRSDNQNVKAYKVVLHDYQHKAILDRLLPKGPMVIELKEGVWIWEEVQPEVPVEYTYTHTFDSNSWGVYETIEIARNAVKVFEAENPDTKVFSIISVTRIIRSDGEQINAYSLVLKNSQLEPIPADNIPEGDTTVVLVDGQWRWAEVIDPEPVDYTYTYDFEEGIWGVYETSELAAIARKEYYANNPGVSNSTSTSQVKIYRGNGEVVIAYKLVMYYSLTKERIINEDTPVGKHEVFLDKGLWKAVTNIVID